MLGPIELVLIAAMLVVLVLEVSYWVIRLAVRSGVTDALRANGVRLESHEHDLRG